MEQYIFCSSAGVYLKSDLMPHREEDDVDPKSRHKARFYPPAMSPLVVTLQNKGRNTQLAWRSSVITRHCLGYFLSHCLA